MAPRAAGLLQPSSVHKAEEALDARRAERIARLRRLNAIVTCPVRWPCAKLLELWTTLSLLGCNTLRAALVLVRPKDHAE